MAIAPIGAASAAATQSVLPTLPSLPTVPAGEAGAAGITGASGESFGAKLAGAVENLAATQATADRLAVDAALGKLTNIHDYMVAATEASLATELTVAVRNKAVDAFNQIMQMGV